MSNASPPPISFVASLITSALGSALSLLFQMLLTIIQKAIWKSGRQKPKLDLRPAFFLSKSSLGGVNSRFTSDDILTVFHRTGLPLEHFRFRNGRFETSKMSLLIDSKIETTTPSLELSFVVVLRFPLFLTLVLPRTFVSILELSAHSLQEEQCQMIPLGAISTPLLK